MKSKILLIALSITLLLGCRRDRDEEQEQEKSETPQPKIQKSVKTIVNVYIENSASMFGYINGNTNFKTNTRELLTQLNFYYGKENVKLHLINSSIYDVIRPDYNNYITNLTSKEFTVGNVFKSELNNVFKQILEKTSKSTLSILISDCIYSVRGNDDDLSVQKTGVKEAYLEKSKKGYFVSSEIIKLNSQFNGTYFDKNSGKHSLQGEVRPYYMIVFGIDSVLSSLNTKIPFNDGKMLGYSNKLILTSNNYSNKIYYTLVNVLSDNGRYRTLREASTQYAYKGMEEIQLNDRVKENFTFSIAIDLKNVPIENSYAEDISNYKIKEGNYRIKNIQKFNSKLLAPNALPIIQNNKKSPTHIITFEATTKNFTNLKCVMVSKIPNWVKDTNTEDDANINNNKNKTFGFKYLIEGISEANQIINSNSKDFFEIDITIKNN